MHMCMHVHMYHSHILRPSWGSKLSSIKPLSYGKNHHVTGSRCYINTICKWSNAILLHAMKVLMGRKGLALDGGEWSASHFSCTLPLGKGSPLPIGEEAQELVWTQRLEEKSFAPARDQTPVIPSVVRHYTDWATPANNTICI
jgi:hypothetical protein